MSNRKKRPMRLILILAVLVLWMPVHSQDDPCSSEAIIASFAEATEMTEWVQQYSACPGQIRRAVSTLAAGRQLLDSEYLPFAAADNPYAFSPLWKWYQGKSASMVHNLDAATNTVTLLADTMTEQRDELTTAPVLAYPVKGNVTAQVKLTFSPFDETHGAGLGIRAAQDLTSWIRITRIGDTIEVVANSDGTSTVIEALPYQDEEDELFLKIERVGTLFTLSFSVNGEDWREVVTDYNHSLPDDSEVFITTFWPIENAAASAAFTQMKVDEG